MARATVPGACRSYLSRRFWFIHYKQVADMPLAATLHAEVALAIVSASQETGRASDRLIDYIEVYARDETEHGIEGQARCARREVEENPRLRLPP
jgi:hypothetical protein